MLLTSVSVAEYSYSHSSSSATGMDEAARGKRGTLSGPTAGQPVGFGASLAVLTIVNAVSVVRY